MGVLLDLLLLLAVILLIWPQPLLATIKHISPVLLVIAAIFCGSLCFFWQTMDAPFTIKALGEKNAAAKGSEIWIKSVVIDGKEYKPEQLFSEGWINENSYLKWRNYDQPFEMKDTIFAAVPRGKDIDILFDSNKWRGQVLVQRGQVLSYVIDCYSNSDRADNNTIAYSTGKTLSGLRIKGKALFLYLFAVLFILTAVSCFVHKTETVHPKQLNRELWLDLLKVFSAFLIVLIHTVGEPYNSTPLESKKWIGYLLLNTIPRCGVPIFIMVSGILLIGKNFSIEKVCQNVKKVVLLLIVWNLIYIVTQNLLWGSTESILRQVLSIPVKRGPSGHLWYSYFLVWIYLFSPIISILYQALSDRMRIYFVALTVVIPGFLDMYAKIFNINTSEAIHSTYLYMTLGYMGLMFIGRMIYDYAPNIKRTGSISFLFVILGLCGTLFITYFYSIKHGKATDQFLSETRLFIVCYASGVLGLSFKYRLKFEHFPKLFKSIIEDLSKNSIGIYFFHCFVLWTVTVGDITFYIFRLAPKNGVFMTFICAILYYFISIVGVGLMARIPGLKKLVT